LRVVVLAAVFDNKAFLNFLYRTLLEREGDAKGIAHWQGKLESGELTRHQVALNFITSTEFQSKIGVFRDVVAFDVFGAKLLVPKGSDAYNELAQGAYEPWVLPYFYELCQPGMVVLDVGASIGNFAIPAAKKIGPQGVVLAIEVSERNARLLLRNAFENGLTNLKVLPFGVSDEIGFALLPAQVYTNNNVLAPFIDSKIGKLEQCNLVPLLPLDILLSHISRLDIIKMDVEGMEYKAVKGARTVIERTRPIIFLEYSPRFQKVGSGVEGPELLLEFLQAGYRVEILHRSRGIERITVAAPEQTAQLIDAAWRHHVSQEGGSHLDLCFLPK
jgi:FkbM family methyltransferase